ncbi:GvpL/GvpF family gas vesicle protein [Streptomyces macrosporus]|uniref:GvpL/GvpF family gas vesicle protein n=1 Tax=Streptomyces macrosporus TaxID=44032 RepID=A0ABN3KHF9_9ACTN
MTDRMAYAYAVACDAEGLPEAVSGLRGVGGAPVRLVRGDSGGPLVAAVSAVPARDFHEEALRENLEDLDWLEAVARSHHGVIEALAARTTVLPLRLATVYLDDERVRSMLDAHRDTFADRLSRLAEHVEWGVKVYVEPPETEDTAPEPAAEPGLGPGRSYLRRRRAQRHSREDVYRAAGLAVERVEAVAADHAVDRARHRVQQGVLAGGQGENVANDAYLVPLDRAERFRDGAVRAADGLPGVRVEVTGPWAPYSFAAPPEEDVAEPARETAS